MLKRGVLLGAVLATALACGSPDSKEESFDPLPVPLADAFETRRQAVNAPGVSVAVWKDGQILYAEGLGRRHPDSRP